MKISIDMKASRRGHRRARQPVEDTRGRALAEMLQIIVVLVGIVDRELGRRRKW